MRKVNLFRLQHDAPSLSRRKSDGDYDSISPKKLPLSEGESQLLLQELYSHVGSAKQSIADQLLPALFSLHTKISQKKGEGPDDGLSVHELLHLANFHIGQGNHAKAAQFYKRINSLYSSLPKEIKGEVYEECMRLHEILKGKM